MDNVRDIVIRYILTTVDRGTRQAVNADKTVRKSVNDTSRDLRRQGEAAQRAARESVSATTRTAGGYKRQGKAAKDASDTTRRLSDDQRQAARTAGEAARGAVQVTTQMSRQANAAARTARETSDLSRQQAAEARAASSAARANDALAGSYGRVTTTGGHAFTIQWDLARSGREAGRGAREGERGTRSFHGQLSRLNTTAMAVRNTMRLLIVPGLAATLGFATQAVGGLVAALFALTAAVGPASGALVAFPAAVATALQAIGTFRLATAGIGDTLKAFQAEQDAAATSTTNLAQQQVQAARRIADAKRGVETAQRSATRAQRELTTARRDATRQLEDMRLAAMRSAITEDRAALSVRRARQELRRALADPRASGIDVAEARVGVREAIMGLREARVEGRRARQDARSAVRGGVAQMPAVAAAQAGVADANRAVADATRQVAEAQHDATAELAAGTAASRKLGNEMDKLSPSAQRFTRFLISLKPRLDTLQATAARGLLPGVERGMRSALRNFPVIDRVIGATGRAMGRVATDAGRLVGSRAFGRDLAVIGNTNAATITRLGGASAHLTSALRHVLVAARPFLTWMGQATERLSSLIDRKARAGRESGRLAAFFERTRQVLQRLGSVLHNTVGGLINVGRAARPLGDDMLAAIDRSARRWNDWTRSVRGQNELRAYFERARGPIFELGRLTSALVRSLLRLGQQRGLELMLRTIRLDLLPAWEEMTAEMTKAFGPEIIRLLASLLRLLGAMSGPLTVLVDLLGGFADLLTFIVQEVPGGKQLLGVFVGMAAAVKAIKFAALITGIRTVSNAWRGVRTAALGAGAAQAAASAGGGAGLLAGLIGPGGRGRSLATQARGLGGRLRGALQSAMAIGLAGLGSGTFFSTIRNRLSAGTVAAGAAGLRTGLRGAVGRILPVIGRLGFIGLGVSMAASMMGGMEREFQRDLPRRFERLAERAQPRLDNVLAGAPRSVSTALEPGLGETLRGGGLHRFSSGTEYNRLHRIVEEFDKLEKQVRALARIKDGPGLRNVARDIRRLARDSSGERQKLLFEYAEHVQNLGDSAARAARRWRNSRLQDMIRNQLKGARTVTGTMVNNIVNMLGDMTPKARVRARRMVLEMVAQMAAKGQLPPNQAKLIVDAVNAQTRRLPGAAEKHGERWAKNLFKWTSWLAQVVAPQLAATAEMFAGVARDIKGDQSWSEFWRNIQRATPYNRGDLARQQREGRRGPGGFFGGLVEDGRIKMQVGGLVPGIKMGDSVRAMLEPGEFVMRRRTVRDVGRQAMNAINRFGRRGLAAATTAVAVAPSVPVVPVGPERARAQAAAQTVEQLRRQVGETQRLAQLQTRVGGLGLGRNFDREKRSTERALGGLRKEISGLTQTGRKTGKDTATGFSKEFDKGHRVTRDTSIKLRRHVQKDFEIMRDSTFRDVRDIRQRTEKDFEATTKTVGRDLGRLRSLVIDRYRDSRVVGARQMATLRKSTTDSIRGASATFNRSTGAMLAQARSRFGAMRNVATAQTARLRTGFASSIGNVQSTAYSGFSYVGDAANKALRAFDVDPIRMSIPRPRERRERGGFLAGAGWADKIPVLAAPKEAFLTRHQQQPVEEALAFAKSMGRSAYGSLDEVFNRERTPHSVAKARASTMTPRRVTADDWAQFKDVAGLAASFYARGGRVPLLGAGAGFGPFMQLLSGKFPGMRVISGRRPGSRVAGSGRLSNHSWGGAVDIATPGTGADIRRAPPAEQAKMDAAHRFIGRHFRPIILDFLWRTMTGGNHYNHIHVGIQRQFSLSAARMARYIRQRRLGDISGFGGDVDLPRLRVRGTEGPMRDLVQSAVNKVRSGAQKYIDEQSAVGGDMGAFPEGGGAGALTREQVMRVFRRAFSIALPYGRFRRMQPGWLGNLVNLAWEESSWRPGVRNNSAAGRAAGGPMGILQVVGSTFRQYALRGYNNPFNALHNAIASIRYQLSRYGRIVRNAPYERGGFVQDAGSFAKGGQFMVRRPTIFEAGEGGRPELITVQPMQSGGRPTTTGGALQGSATLAGSAAEGLWAMVRSLLARGTGAPAARRILRDIQTATDNMTEEALSGVRERILQQMRALRRSGVTRGEEREYTRLRRALAEVDKDMPQAIFNDLLSELRRLGSTARDRRRASQIIRRIPEVLGNMTWEQLQATQRDLEELVRPMRRRRARRDRRLEQIRDRIAALRRGGVSRDEREELRDLEREQRTLRREGRGDESRTLRNLERVRRQVRTAMTQFIEKIVQNAETVQSTLERMSDQVTRDLRSAGLDDASQEGIAALRFYTQHAINVLTEQRVYLEHALRGAQNLGNEELTQSIQEQLNAVNDSLAEATVRSVELWRDAVRQAAADMVEQATSGADRAALDWLRGGMQPGYAASVEVARMGLERLELQQRIAGTFETGGTARADYIRQHIIPALERQLAAQEHQLQAAEQIGDRAGIRQAILDIGQTQIAILQATQEATEQTAENTGEALRQVGGTLGFEARGQQFTDDLVGA